MPTYTINIDLQRCVHCGAEHRNIISTAVGPNRNLFLPPISDHPAHVIHNITESLLPFCPTCMPETLDTETLPLTLSQISRPSISTIDSRGRATRVYTLEDL